jgi:uncharacterized coiled-coil DUF342 family protein
MPKKKTELENMEERNTAIDYINRDIVNIKNELETLNKHVRDGNGQPSLMQQVSTITSDLSHFQKEVCLEINELKEMIKSNHKAISEKSTLNWQFKTAVLVALLSSITTLTMHFFHG